MVFGAYDSYPLRPLACLRLFSFGGYGLALAALALMTATRRVHNSGEVRQNHRSFYDTSKPLGRVVVWTLNFRSEMVATAGSRA